MAETGADASAEQRRRTLQRITAFTDGVVAIALTLLALPLVNLADRSGADEPLAHLLATNRGDLLAAGVSFLVIAQFWRAHRHLYEQLLDYDETLLTLNTLWLMATLFLPVPTARLFTESRLRTDSAIFYAGTLLVIGLASLAQTWWVSRNPGLRARSAGPLPARVVVLAAAPSAIFAGATILAIFSPIGSLLLLIALPILWYGTRRRMKGVARPWDRPAGRSRAAGGSHGRGR